MRLAQRKTLSPLNKIAWKETDLKAKKIFESLERKKKVSNRLRRLMMGGTGPFERLRNDLKFWHLEEGRDLVRIAANVMRSSDKMARTKVSLREKSTH